MRLAALLAILALGGCASMTPKSPNLFGQWGGRGVGLLLEGGLGSVEFDCASGTVDTAILPGAEGRFSAVGTVRTGQGGPVRVGQVFRAQRATYSGSVDKTAMTLSVRLEDGTMMGPFALTQGAAAQLDRCL